MQHSLLLTSIGFFISLVFSSGCSNASPSSECENFDRPPQGQPSQYALANGGTLQDVAVAAPVVCEHESAYIRVERATGARRLGTGMRPDGGFGEGCTAIPETPDALNACPVIDHSPIYSEISEALKQQGIIVNGIGMGPCGIEGDYDSWNMSIGVVSWKDADAAVQKASEVLVKYDLRGHMGIAVVGIDCATPRGLKSPFMVRSTAS